MNTKKINEIKIGMASKSTVEPKASFIVTPKGRLSYPHLLERNDGGMYPSGKYETAFLMPKDSSDISALEAAVNASMRETFGTTFTSYQQFKNPPILDGDDKPSTKGYWVIKAKSDNRPQIVGPNPKMTVDDPEQIYGGQWAKLSLNVYGYKKPGNSGVSFGLKNVQILGGGERFGGGSGNPEDQFSEEKEENGAGQNW